MTTAQLAAAGLGPNAVAHRVANGRLTRMLRGVYRVGPIAAPYSAEMAALLATSGALSFHSSAPVWGIRPPYDGPVHVTVTRAARSREGVKVHRSASLDAVVHNGLTLTTPARTLHDLAPVLSRADLERAAEEAVIRGLAHGEGGAAAVRGIQRAGTDALGGGATAATTHQGGQAAAGR